MNILDNHNFLNDLKKLGVNIDFEIILSNQYLKFIKNDSLIIDVGGHSGLHTKNFKNIIGPSGKVLFIEPLDYIVDKSIFANNVIYFNCAVSNYIGDAEFVLAQGTPQESGFKERMYNNPNIANPKKIKVSVNTIDEIMKEYSSCDYIKIDTEGSELLCIDGAMNTIKKYRPIISIEYGYPSYNVYGLTYKSLWDKCQEINYDICDIFLNKIETLELWSKICDLSSWDFFLIPKS
jgi:FkbM family methyltransferase